MNVRFVWTLYWRGEEIVISYERTWPSSMTSPVFIRCTARMTGAGADVQLPAGPEVDVEDGEDEVLLVARPIDAVDRSDVAVVLQAGGDARGDLVGDLRGRREAEPAARVLTLERALERRVEGPVPAPE